MKRKPPERDELWETNRVLAYRRDKGRCQLPGRVALEVAGECGDGTVIHHIRPAGRGGKRDHTLSNLVTLCPHHHDWVHSHPIEAKEADLLRSGHDRDKPVDTDTDIV